MWCLVDGTPSLVAPLWLRSLRFNVPRVPRRKAQCGVASRLPRTLNRARVQSALRCSSNPGVWNTTWWWSAPVVCEGADTPTIRASSKEAPFLFSAVSLLWWDCVLAVC